MSKIIRISEQTDSTLNELKGITGKTKQDLVDKAIEKFYREFFIKKANKAYEELKKNKEDWQQELEERKAWDKTLSDGLTNE